MLSMAKRFDPDAYRLVGGILSTISGYEPYASIISAAEQLVGSDFAGNKAAQAHRKRLITAIKQNIINRRDYPYEVLLRKYGLAVGRNKFVEEKQRFVSSICGALADGYSPENKKHGR